MRSTTDLKDGPLANSVPIPKRSASDIDTPVVDGLKALDPIREVAKMPQPFAFTAL
jgi:hypothetical protein